MAIEVGQYDFEVYQGSPVSRTVTFKDNANVLLDFSGYTAGKMQIKKNPSVTAPAAVELSTTNGKLSIGSGTITFSLTGADTALLQVASDSDSFPREGSYYYDIQLTTSGGVETTWLYGVITVLGQVTS